MSLSNFSENLALNFLFNTSAVTRPTAWYVQLHMTDPTDTGTAGTQPTITAGDYDRKTLGTSGMTTSTASTCSNPAAVSWTADAAAATYTFTHISIWDKSNNLLIEDCEDVWNESVDADVTVSVVTDAKAGTNSNKFVVAATAVAGDILATEAIPATDISTATDCRFWIKTSVATAAGDLQLLLSEAANAATPAETLNVPALVANTWTYVKVALASAAASRDAIISVGLKYAVDIGACDIYIDDIQALLPAPAGNCLGAGQLPAPETIAASQVLTLPIGKIIAALD